MHDEPVEERHLCHGHLCQCYLIYEHLNGSGMKGLRSFSSLFLFHWMAEVRMALVFCQWVKYRIRSHCWLFFVQSFTNTSIYSVDKNKRIIKQDYMKLLYLRIPVCRIACGAIECHSTRLLIHLTPSTPVMARLYGRNERTRTPTVECCLWRIQTSSLYCTDMEIHDERYTPTPKHCECISVSIISPQRMNGEENSCRGGATSTEQSYRRSISNFPPPFGMNFPSRVVDELRNYPLKWHRWPCMCWSTFSIRQRPSLCARVCVSSWSWQKAASWKQIGMSTQYTNAMACSTGPIALRPRLCVYAIAENANGGQLYQ